jgi:hypothetical protein
MLEPEKTPSKNKGFDKREFASMFFELLMHCHGLNTEAHNALSEREIWCLAETTMKKIKRELAVLKTPSKRCQTTPRKAVTRNNHMRAGFTSAKRSLFKSHGTPTPVYNSILFI